MKMKWFTKNEHEKYACIFIAVDKQRYLILLINTGMRGSFAKSFFCWF